MTLEQQVASLVTATTDLTSVVNTELNNVRQENTNFKNGIVDSQGQGIFNGVKIGTGGGNSGFNLAVGNNCFVSNQGGLQNLALGLSALQFNISGNANTAIGNYSLQNCTSGTQNTAIGINSLNKVTVGSHNQAIGSNALYSLVDGGGNIAIGSSAGNSLTNGVFNVVAGYTAFASATTAYNSVAIGTNSQVSCVSGVQNTAVGMHSMSSNVTGSNNTAIGFQSLYTSANIANSTGVGYLAEVSGSNQVQLGNSQTTTYVYGTVQNRSDVRDKTDIRNTILGLDFIKSLRPVDYRWDMREDYKPVAPEDPGIEATDEQKARYQSEVKIWLEACKLKNIVHNGTKKRNRFHHGLIAQEVKAVLTQKGIDFGGYQDHSISGGDAVLSLGYDQFIAPLIKAVQELSTQNEALAARISALESK